MMFLYEEYLVKAIKECKISALVQDLGGLYLVLVAKDKTKTVEEFNIALKISRILDKAAEEISNLGAKH